MKTNILEAGTKHQIGGKPRHRVEEHLITAKALISRSRVTEGGCMIRLVNSLRGVMRSLYTRNIPMKAYGICHKLNSKTVIQVATPSGMTERGEAGGLCGQG